MYYRGDQIPRIKGYYLYVSDSFSDENPNSGHECYHYPMSGQLPNTIQNKTCDLTGRYVVYYNERDGIETYVELCEVEVFGCPVGRHGSQCEFSCPDNCNDVTCSILDGSCTSCKAGFKGNRCDQECDTGTFGNNCLQKCTNCLSGNCDRFNGTCGPSGVCKSGWRGPGCNDTCGKGTYGINCSMSCSNCINESCDHFMGNCLIVGGCKAGYYGSKCSEECDTGTFGNNCLQKCTNCLSGNCDRFNGTCGPSGVCKSGWRGPGCNDTCGKGTYGINCSMSCSNCINESCDHFMGNCLIVGGCKAGYHGSKCSEECERGTFGKSCLQKCRNCISDNCDRFNGTCDPLGVCKSGWRGPKCNDKCERGTFGKDCLQKCRNCITDNCDNSNGTCDPLGVCKSGWRGPRCKDTCGKGTYGENCSMSCGSCINESCDHFNGNCIIFGDCKAGYHGSKCREACGKGTYGENCSMSCSNCKNESCDHFNGNCMIVGGCKAGYQGSKCSEECDRGFYGVNCAMSCSNCINESCDHLEGICQTVGSCKAGYRGSKCNQYTFPLKISKAQWIIIGGVIGAILAVIAIILIVISVYRKRANGPGKPIRGTQFSSEVTELFNPGYSNETFESPQYAHVEKENQMSFKGIMVELGNVLMTENLDANGTIPDNLYPNIESIDAENLYSNTEAENVFSEYNIAVGNLLSVAKMKRKNNAFKKECFMLPMGLHFPHSEGEREENIKKNRFLTTFPYDHSRVKLEVYDTSTDYINANYIKNYSKDKAYIATQGPKKITLSDFWQMIWQENVDTIIMVTKLVEGDKKKCDQYWPESTHKQVLIGKFTLEMLEEKENTVYIYRCIQLSCEHTDRTVHQFHFTQWPDHDVPDKTHLVNFYRKVKSRPTNGSGPMVVHCSAGIGRTGTFLALDALYEHGKTTGFVNIMEYTHMMRQDRMNMIQTVEQYATVYDVLVEAFTVPQSAIPRQNFLNMLDSRLIEREYQKLQDLKPTIEANKFQAGKRKENVSKNAVQNILPHDDYRPYLMSYGRSSNDYINAVKIPSFREGKNILVTQYPLQSTIGDLWSLIYDNDCRTMVILEKLDEDVIPSNTYHRFSNDNFIISRNSSNVLQDKLTISLRHKNKKEERPITVFVYNDWGDNNMMPNSTKTMADFMEKVSRTTREDNESIVVICRDGCTRCGIFVTLDLVLEKMEIDEEIDIFQVARQIQTRRPQFLSSIEQFEFCYCALKELLNSESVYANSGNLLSVYR
ncbi:receptor-type tyrosine-protein phosphatase mu-like isoform X2 [Mytilus californianus]|nr:receptor-type tyrosine-protein phosphatase mu-like isoform X2 [Mytilus californianus]